VRVLYVSHTGQVSGAEEALCDLLRVLPTDVEPLAGSPRGPLWERLEHLGIPVHELPATEGSLRLHPSQTPRAIGALAHAGGAIARLTRRQGADVVHANSVRAGLTTTLAAAVGAPRPVVYVHDCLPPGPVSRVTREVVGGGASVVLTNSRHSAWRFRTPLMRNEPRVVYYGLDSRRFDPRRIDRSAARAALGLREGEVALAVVGQLTPWKGQDHAIRLLARLREQHPSVRLVLAGMAKFTGRATRYDNVAYVRELHDLAHALNVEQQVLFTGQMDDVPTLLRATDVALVPSWEEPFGRSVTEAMAMEVPVVATSVGGPSEVISHGQDGFLEPPREVEPWLARVSGLVADPELRATMGHRGRTSVLERFPMAGYLNGVLEAYEAA
jgi:L-malate glycosyltransferase